MVDYLVMLNEETIVFQRINGFDFNFSGYQSKEACRDFMNSTLDYFFEHEIGCKLKVMNSMGIHSLWLFTDKSVVGQEATYTR